MTLVRFVAKISKIGIWTILSLPKSASAKLPSRGLVIVDGTINGKSFQAPLEPDGRKGHWMKMDKTMLKSANADVGSNLILEIEPVKELPEPKIPSDLMNSLKKDKEAIKLWKDITPLARWDWIRWINGTKNPQTRKIRIDKTLSKLNSGKRNACCFNRSECTDPDVSHRGMLIEA